MGNTVVSSNKETWMDVVGELLFISLLFLSTRSVFLGLPSFCPWYWHPSFPWAPGFETHLLSFLLSNHLPGLVYSFFTEFFPPASLMSPDHGLWVFDLSLRPFNLWWDWFFKTIAFTIFFKVEKDPAVVRGFRGKLTVLYGIQSHPGPDPCILLPLQSADLYFLFKASVSVRSSNSRQPHCYVLIFFQGLFWDTLCVFPFLSQRGPRFSLHSHLLQILLPCSQLNYISAPMVTTLTICCIIYPHCMSPNTTPLQSGHCRSPCFADEEMKALTLRNLTETLRFLSSSGEG